MRLPTMGRSTQANRPPAPGPTISVQGEARGPSHSHSWLRDGRRDVRLLVGATVAGVALSLLSSMVDGVHRDLSGLMDAVLGVTLIVAMALGVTASLRHRDLMPTLIRLMGCTALYLTVAQHGRWAIFVFGLLALVYALIWDIYYLSDE